MHRDRAPSRHNRIGNAIRSIGMHSRSATLKRSPMRSRTQRHLRETIRLPLNKPNPLGILRRLRAAKGRTPFVVKVNSLLVLLRFDLKDRLPLMMATASGTRGTDAGGGFS